MKDPKKVLRGVDVKLSIDGKDIVMHHRPEDPEIIRTARNSVVNIFKCWEKAGYHKVIISSTSGPDQVGWVEPESVLLFPPIQVLGQFGVVEIT